MLASLSREAGILHDDASRERDRLDEAQLGSLKAVRRHCAYPQDPDNPAPHEEWRRNHRTRAAPVSVADACRSAEVSAQSRLAAPHDFIHGAVLGQLDDLA